MEGNLAKELYSESFQLSKVELDPTSNSNIVEEDLLHDDGSLWDASDDELDKAYDLDREWQRRRDRFHSIGYRDGLMAGKEASAQEGFNLGFKQSMVVGYNLGVVRGVTSALACLPKGLKDRLIETQEKRNQFQQLYESVHSLSTTDALKLFHHDITNKSAEQSENGEASTSVAGLQELSADCSHLGNYFGELQSLLIESPAIKVHYRLQWCRVVNMGPVEIETSDISYHNLPIDLVSCYPRHEEIVVDVLF